MGQIIRKDATITNPPDDDFPGSFQVILSAPTKDRDGETLLPDEWKQPLPEHITFDQDHTMTVAGTIGSGTPHIDEDTGNLIVDGTYSSIPEAQKVRTLVNEGHIRTTSVAFMSEKSTKDGKATVTRELLNGAFVAIPSNREALVLSSKGLNKAENKPAGTVKAFVDVEFRYGGAKSGESEAIGTVFVDVLPRFADPDYKSIAGSIEAVQERASQALRAANEDYWVWLRGTVPDGNGGGYLVYEDGDGGGSFKQEFTDDGETVTLVGEPVAVSVHEVATPLGGTTEDDGEPASGTSNDKSAGTVGVHHAPANPEKSLDGPTTEESEELEASKKRSLISRLSANI